MTQKLTYEVYLQGNGTSVYYDDDIRAELLSDLNKLITQLADMGITATLSIKSSWKEIKAK